VETDQLQNNSINASANHNKKWWRVVIIPILSLAFGYLAMALFLITIGRGLFIAAGFFALLVCVFSIIVFVTCTLSILRRLTGRGEWIFYGTIVVIMAYVVFGIWQFSSVPGPMYQATLVPAESSYHVGDRLTYMLRPETGAVYSKPIALNIFLKKPDGSIITESSVSVPNNGNEEYLNGKYIIKPSDKAYCFINYFLKPTCEAESLNWTLSPYDSNIPQEYRGATVFYFDEPGTWILYSSSSNVESATIQVEPTSDFSIEDISPKLGSVGTKVTITGTELSSQSNIIIFSHGSDELEAADIPSTDGKSLTFNIPKSWKACLTKNGFGEPMCNDYSPIVAPHYYTIWIWHGSSKTSNPLNFIVTK